MTILGDWSSRDDNGSAQWHFYVFLLNYPLLLWTTPIWQSLLALVSHNMEPCWICSQLSQSITDKWSKSTYANTHVAKNHCSVYAFPLQEKPYNCLFWLIIIHGNSCQWNLFASLCGCLGGLSSLDFPSFKQILRWMPYSALFAISRLHIFGLAIFR